MGKLHLDRDDLALIQGIDQHFDGGDTTDGHTAQPDLRAGEQAIDAFVKIEQEGAALFKNFARAK